MKAFAGRGNAQSAKWIINIKLKQKLKFEVNMEILSMKFRNFKGFKDFKWVLDCKNGSAYGANGTGKTTLADGFFWLLFGKNSLNQKDFEIKPLDENNQPVHNLNTEVEMAFNCGGNEFRPIILKKIYSEKWTKKRGQAEAEFTGHTVDHFIDTVPVKEKEYLEKINTLAGSEERFKLLSNPRHFSEVMKWEARRSLLLQVCGNVSDSEVINSSAELADLALILKGRSLEDHRKVLAGQKAEINKALETIPIRIDELSKGLPDALNVLPLEKIKELRQKRSALEEQMNAVKAGGGEIEKRIKIKEIEAKMLESENQHNLELNKQIIEAQRIKFELAEKHNALTPEMTKLQLYLTNAQVDVPRHKDTLENLRQIWIADNSRIFEAAIASICPACGQSLPDDIVCEARKKAEAQFNLAKSQKLESLAKDGKNIASLLAEIDEKSEKANVRLEELAAIGERITAQVNEQDAFIASLKAQKGEYSNLPEYLVMATEKQMIEEEIKALAQGTEGQQNMIADEIAAVNQEILAAEQELAKERRRTEDLDRIEQLENEQKKLGQEFARLQKEVFLCEQFTRAKVEMLEGKINSKFQITKFKMFKELINGGLEDCCEPTLNGIPYSTGASNGERILMGLDILKTLQAHYKFRPPVIIDNRESYTGQISLGNTQVISLYVSENHSKLTTESAERINP